jgi:hypothetical protein
VLAIGYKNCACHALRLSGPIKRAIFRLRDRGYTFSVSSGGEIEKVRNLIIFPLDKVLRMRYILLYRIISKCRNEGFDRGTENGSACRKRLSAERMRQICLVDGVFTMTALRLPGAVDTGQKRKRAGSPGHARSARRLARPGRGMGITILARPGRTTSTTSITTPLARPGARGAWRVVASPLALAAGASRLALVVVAQVGRA